MNLTEYEGDEIDCFTNFIWRKLKDNYYTDEGIIEQYAYKE